MVKHWKKVGSPEEIPSIFLHGTPARFFESFAYYQDNETEQNPIKIEKQVALILRNDKLIDSERKAPAEELEITIIDRTLSVIVEYVPVRSC